MAEEKLCPMSFNSPEQIDILKCKKEKCAWWNADENNCAIHMLAHYVSAIWAHRYNTER